jgi:hypothetical protein
MFDHIKLKRRKPLQWIVGTLIVILALMIFLPFVQRIHWVGSTDLTVEFIVADAETGQRIVGATIKIQSEGGFYKERGSREFDLITGTDGTSEYECLDNMCFGTSGGFTNTYVVHLPSWFYKVTAPGYRTTELIYLNEHENVRRVQHIGRCKDKLTVATHLHRMP